jgi:hypothetical protein
MRYKYILQVIAFALVLHSCKKEKGTTVQPPPPPVKPVLLKDIVIPNLPSPYYHFEYNMSGRISKASFLSGLRMYDIVYNGNKISTVNNNTLANKDRLQYIYNETGTPEIIKYINEAGLLYRVCYLTYDGGQLRKMEWEKRIEAGFIIDRTITFVYQPDGNLLEMTDHRPAIIGQQAETTYIVRFEQYDNNINTDGFSLAHEDNDHLLLLPGVQLQKNNPRKIIRTGDAINYTIDYTYTHNDRNAPLTKAGDVIITGGPNTGQRFQVNTVFTYYQ